MAKVLFLFLDGVGLGADDARRNPFVAADLPNLTGLLEGRRLVADNAPFEGQRGTLLSLDAGLGVEGTPQSATGQAVLLTGENVPARLGRHYGPKPNDQVAAILREDNLFSRVLRGGGRAALLNAYPPVYFEAIQSGRRLYSAIPMAADAAGLPLMTAEDLQAGRALAADFTGVGWAAQESFPPTPIYDGPHAGRLLADLSSQYDLAWFDYWASDYAGHKQAFDRAVGLMESFDAVLGGLLASWQDRQDLILLSSDHGNMEDMEIRGHTLNPVPGLLIGPRPLRRRLADSIGDLTDIAPAVMAAIEGEVTV